MSRWVHDSTLAKLLKVEAIVLYPWIFTARKRGDVDERLRRHELTHVEQVRRLGWLRFYSNYLGWYFFGLIKYRSHVRAYLEIPYEKEARAAETRPA